MVQSEDRKFHHVEQGLESQLKMKEAEYNARYEPHVNGGKRKETTVD